MSMSYMRTAEGLLQKQAVVDRDSLTSRYDRADHALVLEALQRACECWCRIDKRSRVIVDRSGHWLASDQMADERLRYSVSGLTVANGKLQASNEFAPQLKDLLQAAEEPVTVVLPQARDQGHVILRSVAFDEDLVCIVVKDVDGSLDADFAGLEVAFGLTPAEIGIVTMILNGHCAAKIAAERGLSINTVRAHLRHCYEKLGVSCREQLWCKIYPFQMQ